MKKKKKYNNEITHTIYFCFNYKKNEKKNNNNNNNNTQTVLPILE
jgi:hypothetical protein